MSSLVGIYNVELYMTHSTKIILLTMVRQTTEIVITNMYTFWIDLGKKFNFIRIEKNIKES